MLAVEVSDMTLRRDRRVKHALYASAGIPEFWIVNLAAKQVEVCRSPTGEQYASVSHVGREAVLEPQLLPGATIPVSALLR